MAQLQLFDIDDPPARAGADLAGLLGSIGSWHWWRSAAQSGGLAV